MTWGWIEKEEITCFLTFLSTSLHTTWISYLSYVWAGILRQLYILCSWHQTCAVVETLWHSDKHSDIPRDKRMKPALSCPIYCYRTWESVGRIPAPTLVSITGSDRSIWQERCPAGCPSSLSLWSICTSIGPALVDDAFSAAACQKRARSHRGSANIL